KQTGQPTGQAAVARGLITEDQLLLALADQNGLKVVNMEEVKAQPEAVALVPETMASVYKILPLILRDNGLTVALSDRGTVAAIANRRTLLTRGELKGPVAPAKWMAENTTNFYAGKKESIVDTIQHPEADTPTGTRRGETSIDLEDMMEMAEAAPV